MTWCEWRGGRKAEGRGDEGSEMKQGETREEEGRLWKDKGKVEKNKWEEGGKAMGC